MTDRSVRIEGPATTLDEVFRMVRRRAWLPIACVAMSLAAGYAYYIYAVPVYKVSARLLVEHDELPLDSRRPPSRFEEEFIATQAQIVSSPAVVRPVVESVGWTSDEPGVVDPTESLLESLTVKPIAGTNVLDIGFRSPKTDESVEAVHAIIKSYQRYLGELEQDSYQETLSLLTRKEKEARRDLEELEEEHRALRKEGLLVGRGGEAQNLHQDTLVELNRELNAAKDRRIRLENALQMLAAQDPAEEEGELVRLASSDKLDPPYARRAILRKTEPELREPTKEDLAVLMPLMGELQIEGYRSLEAMKLKRFEAQDQHKKLSKIYAPNNITMVALREEIDAWDERIREQREALPVVLQMELKSVRDREDTLGLRYHEELEKARAMDAHQLREEQVVARIQRVQGIHDSLLTQLKHLELQDAAAAHGQSDVRVTVLAVPELSEAPVWPSRTIVFGVCGLMGLVGGFGLVVATERRKVNA